MAKSPESERERIFQVSSNRGSASHKLRYVEASVSVDELQDCRMCRTALVPPRASAAASDAQPEQPQSDTDEGLPTPS